MLPEAKRQEDLEGKMEMAWIPAYFPAQKPLASVQTEMHPGILRTDNGKKMRVLGGLGGSTRAPTASRDSEQSFFL